MDVLSTKFQGVNGLSGLFDKIANNMIYGNITQTTPVVALFADTEPMLSEKDGIINRIKEIDNQLKGGEPLFFDVTKGFIF